MVSTTDILVSWQVFYVGSTLGFEIQPLIHLHRIIFIFKHTSHSQPSHKGRHFTISTKFIYFFLALNGGGRFLSPSSPLSSLLCSLVSWETLSALLSKLKYYGLTGLLMQLTLSKLGFRGTWLPWRNVRSRLYDGRVGEVANRVSGGSFRGGHWYLPIRNHDNRYFADWIRLCPGLSKNSENGNSCPKPHKAARVIEAVGRAVSIETEL